MKATRLHDYGDPEQFVYEDVPDPTPGPGEVVVKVAAASVNPMDYKLRGGAMREFLPFQMPVTFGWDVAGMIAAVGPDVTSLKVGDRVMGMLSVPRAGGYAEQVVTEASLLNRVPDGLDLEQAAALPMVALTARRAVEHHLKPRPGQTVLVSGALGAIGRLVVHYVSRSGARVIAGVRGRQREEAAGLGAADVVALDDPADLARLGPFDGIVDMAGGTTAQMLLDHVRPGGLFVAVNPPPPAAPEDGRVRVELVQVQSDPEVLRAVAEDVARGDLSLPIAARLPLSEAGRAHRLLEAGGLNGKVLLVP